MIKSYNPFKMWGSYFGAILSFFFMPIYSRGRFGQINWNFFNMMIREINGGYFQIEFNAILLIFSIIFIPLIGFLIGWGIHSLFRRFSK